MKINTKKTKMLFDGILNHEIELECEESEMEMK